MKNQSPTFVRGDGPTAAKYIFVGSQPSVQEIRRSPRKPFSDAGGKELISYLRTNEIIRSECYFTYVIKSLDYPLPHYLSYNTRKKEMKVSADADMYMEMLKQELELCSANIIFAVGNEALFALTSRTGITKWRGSILESTLLPGRKVIPIISPKTVIAPNFQFTNRYLILRDMEKGVKEAEFPELIEHEMQLLIEPSFYRAVEFLLFCIAQGKHGAIIQIDIEVIGEIDCISFAYDEHNCMSIPLVGSSGHYFSIEQEIEIWLLIAQLLEDPDIDQGGQNFIFDLAFIFRKFGIVAHGVSHDTMIAQKMLYPDFRVGLDFITAWYTKLPYYKADGKQWMKFQAGSRHEWWNYNARDSIACAIALPQQLDDLDEIGNQPTYYNKLKIISPLMYMMERGIKVDTAGMLRERDKTQRKIADINTQIWEIAGKEINTNSPKQLANYFYVDLKHKPYKKRTAKGWVTTTDEIAMKRLSRKGIPVAKLVLKIRKLNKRLGTYLNLSKISSDSRARCQYKPHGADTGRLASSEDIFGEGSNQQNWPHDLMSYLVPDTGYIFYSFDLSQIENRIVGYVGNVTHMISAFESKIDLHRKTASLLFDTTIEEVSSEAGSSPFSDERSQRDDGKRCNHSLNYDFGYRSFALRFEMPERDAKWIVEKYHSTYPEVRNNYHKQIQLQLGTNRVITNLKGRKRLFLGKLDDNLYKIAYAHLPQSTVADVMDETIAYIYDNQDLFGPVELLIQIHDSVGFQIPLSIGFAEHARILSLIHAFMCQPLKVKTRSFVVPTDLTIGLNLNKHESLELKNDKMLIPEHDLAIKLEEIHDTLVIEKQEREDSDA